jgi:hypothetical protein
MFWFYRKGICYFSRDTDTDPNKSCKYSNLCGNINILFKQLVIFTRHVGNCIQISLYYLQKSCKCNACSCRTPYMMRVLIKWSAHTTSEAIKRRFTEIGEARRTWVLRSLSRKIVNIYKNEEFLIPKSVFENRFWTFIMSIFQFTYKVLENRFSLFGEKWLMVWYGLNTKFLTLNLLL